MLLRHITTVALALGLLFCATSATRAGSPYFSGVYGTTDGRQGTFSFVPTQILSVQSYAGYAVVDGVAYPGVMTFSSGVKKIDITWAVAPSGSQAGLARLTMSGSRGTGQIEFLNQGAVVARGKLRVAR
jgi:hypothetical protein